jgi:chloramphenicol-sensitive protein RarD
MNGTSQARLGVLMGIGAYTIWGLLPLFIRAMAPLFPTAILAQRVVWSLLIIVVLAFVLRRWPAALAALRQPRILLALVASTLLIAANWLLYIYAINSGHALQASLGYFINPLLNIVLGMIFFGERLGRMETGAVLLAGVGVLALAIYQGSIPYIPLGLAASFGLYGLVRKKIALGPVEGLLIETGLLAPFAAIWLLTMPQLAPGATPPAFWLLVLSGVATTMPLLLFAGAANRIRYSDLGLLQYIGPTLQMLIAIHVFGEPLLPIHLLSFGLIWAGLALYVAATLHRSRMVLSPPE